ncbi:MAG: UDP-N-acetylglucosamine 1-carboxyvinyltransferase [bacterium]
MRYKITGGKPLKGTLFVQGSKNAALPMIAAALLPKKGQTVLKNVPPLNDIKVLIQIAESIGAKLTYFEDKRILVIDAEGINNSVLDSELSNKLRASILFLPVILHRLGKVEINGAGGCSLGRKLDFHYNGFKRLGAKVDIKSDDKLKITAKKLVGNVVYSDIPSWTGTENLIMAASLAKGKTTIENAASEPEIVDFANMLIQMGAKIYGAGTQTITVEGVAELNPVEYRVLPDRLDAGTFMIGAAMTQGDITLIGADLDCMKILKIKLEQMGATVENNGKTIRVKGLKQRPRPINIVTWPYPGFATDLLPAMMAFSALADGTSYLRENVYESRFSQADGLNSFGAKITAQGNVATVEGVDKLRGASVSAPDLRAGMAYVLAGLAAEGETIIDNIYQIERGHSNTVERLKNLGADISLF